MVVASWRPDIAFQVPFNADPNDPAAVPSWSDLSARFLSASAVSRGRQYELDQNQASQPTIVLDDPDEKLNPGNTASPYYPDVVPYRQCLFQAMWPNQSTGNVLNTGYGANNLLGTTAGYDPSWESYTNGATVVWVTAVGGTTPTVTTTNPQQGTKDLTWTVSNGATVQGVQLTIPCIPGRQYTMSGYVRQSSGSTQTVTVDGSAGSTTTTTGSYVRLTKTFTATQPTEVVKFVTSGTAVAGTVNLDAIQLDQGASASTFTTSGPVIYWVFGGYVERWPSAWDFAGFRGRAEICCLDALGVLNKVALWTEYRNSVLAKSPYYFWSLGEPQGATAFADVSGNNGPSLVPIVSKYGGGTNVVAGSSITIPGDPGAAGVQFTPPAPQNASASAGTIIGAGSAAGTSFAFPADPPTTTLTATVAAWVTLTSAAAPNTYQQIVKVAQWVPNQSTQQAVGVVMTSAGYASAELWGSAYANAVRPVGSALVNDGLPHLVLGTMTQASGGNTTVTIYVDGVSVGTSTVATSSPGMIDTQLGQLQVGGQSDSVIFGQIQQGVISAVAIWDRVLTSDEITDLTAAGAGYVGETSGGRISRYLSYSFVGPTNVGTGLSTMGVANLSADTATLSACQAVAATESGNFWAAGTGAVTFTGRDTRYLATTSSYTFGENVTGGEYPYQDGIGFDEDPTFLYNAVTVNQFGGVAVTVTDPASQLRYFPNGYSLDVNCQTANEAIDHANYLLNQHAEPRQRIAAITLDPASYPTLWPVVLGLELGARVTVKRRASGGALVMSGDYFVEQISHDSIDMEAGTWLTTLRLSPVDLYQVGILDDATYGLLDSTMILAF